MTDVIHQIDQGILSITLNRPEKLNALNSDVLDTLNQLFLDAKDNPSIRALLITGSGKAFCAGADIRRLAACNGETGYAFARAGQTIFRSLETLGKPSLAAINGYAFGGGCELSMAATLRISSINAQFAQPEVKLGVLPGYGGTQRLARLVGKGRALDLCLTGRTIDAKMAESWGLISEIVEPDELLERAKTILKSILSMAPLAVRGVMDVIDGGYDLSLPDAFELEALHFSKVCATYDKTEGVSAFLEKRAAVFKGE
ncbi:MAG: enoyl-CoA hydratase/isomerase family protein [Gammaproteobacteria bacterium]|nr:enoyl-CoA hydratase/isomerase family protein [Gammaproteobacteria bacterium]